MASSLKVGVVGAGPVGATLGGRLVKAGRAVKYGTRDASSAKVLEVLRQQPGATADSVHATVAWADVLILAVPGSQEDAGIKATAASLGEKIAGKVLIDATNPLSGWPGLEIRHGQLKSGGEVLAEALPHTSVYKAFNTLGVEQLGLGDGGGEGGIGQQLTMLFAGPPDAEQRAAAAAVVADVGFTPVYVGPIRYARNLESIAELWIHLGVPGSGFSTENFGRNFHFQYIKKE